MEPASDTALRLRLGGISLAVALVVMGCAHYPVNAPLEPVDARTGYRFQNRASPTNSQELLLVLAFSGGGTRAAALAYGVLEELAHTQVGPPGEQHRLLDEVDVISAVSGGSFTAAYYALWGDRIFANFERQFLKKHVQNGLLCRSLNPWNQARLASPKFNTSDLAAEYYDRLLFAGATFRDLAARPGAPFLLINATDIGLGERFEFSQDQFDLIKSDLSQLPVARAVAASSAFPVLLSPIVVRNYSADRQPPEPEWIQPALDDPGSPSRLQRLAREARSYVNGRGRHFLHLLDGGITDNLGLRGVVDRAILRASLSGPLRNLALEKSRQIAVIIVDAHAEREHGWDSTERAPGTGELIGALERVTIGRYSFETLELFKESAARMVRDIEAVRLEAGADGPAQVTFYTMELHFSQLSNEADRRFFNSVPTRLQLPSATVDRLRRLAAAELAGNSEFRRLVRDLREVKK